MSAKTSTAQQPGRRTPLSLNAGTKQTNKPPSEQNDNTNTKKESIGSNQQKTDTSRKDSQSEKKQLSSDKKQHSTAETRKPSTSSDTKKGEDSKTAKEDTKKSQNGVSSTNGVKNKSTEETKPKDETSSSGGGTPKRNESQKVEKKKETPSKVAVNDGKTEDNRKDEVKEKTTDDTTKKERKREKHTKEDAKDVSEKKKPDEKLADTKSTDDTKAGEKSGKDDDVIIILDCEEKVAKEEPVVKEKKKEEVVAAKSPAKIDETPKPEPQQTLPAEELEDVDMEPLTVEPELSQISAASTPAKAKETYGRFGGVVKTSPSSEVKPSKPQLIQTPDRKSCPRSFSAISGRRSIRPIGDYTFSGSLQIRESYRKINTELDYTASSLNVTVGSEVPNDSFSFFSRSRKRDRSSPVQQSAMDISPKSPKRARIEMGVSGFFSAMASPITMLRARLSRATVQSTPKKHLELPVEDEVVENVSGISIEEELTATEDLTVNADAITENAATADEQQTSEEPAVTTSEKPAFDEGKYDDIKVKETFTATTDVQAKKKCTIM